ncbi:unnamed protein product [Colias eurytheme]|nr:unnamed protein product [Colias eurytheme]
MWLRAIVFIVVAKCVSAAWNNAVYYRIIVDSFKDLDGDGLGDLMGVTKQLSYVKALGADAVILSPIQAKSPDCTRPGTLDFTTIDQRYGNMDIFNKLIEKAKKLDLKVLMSLDVQRISSASEWFNHSAGKRPGYEDWVVWRDGPLDKPPVLEDGIDAWIWNEERHGFWASKNNETILNLCSESLIEALKGAQCSWLQKGVSGFILTPDYYLDYECGIQIVKKMSTSAASCARAANMENPIILVETALDVISANYFGDTNGVISKALTGSQRSTPDLALALHASLLFCPQDMTPTWLTSARQESRITTRYGSELVDAINLIALILPGSTIIHQGDELGAADTILEWATIDQCWPTQSHPSLAPFPWDDSNTAGFTSGEPWLPLAPNYRYANAKSEFANDLSHVGVVRVATAMRKSPAFGPHVEIKRFDDALAILRWGGSGSLLVISNLGRKAADVLLSKIPGVAAEMTVAASSGGSSLSSGGHVHTDKLIKLNPGETLLLAGPPRHCGGPGPVDKITNKLSEGWQKLNKYFSNS